MTAPHLLFLPGAAILNLVHTEVTWGVLKSVDTVIPPPEVCNLIGLACGLSVRIF
jgi:hypothetical protein